MNIPKTFTLMGRDHTVEFDYSLMNESDWGQFGEQRASIKLYPTDGEIEVDRSMVEATFCHELVHALLSAMGETEINMNERFVDLMGKLLHQYMVTNKGSL